MLSGCSTPGMGLLGDLDALCSTVGAAPILPNSQAPFYHKTKPECAPLCVQASYRKSERQIHGHDLMELLHLQHIQRCSSRVNSGSGAGGLTLHHRSPSQWH